MVETGGLLRRANARAAIAQWVKHFRSGIEREEIRAEIERLNEPYKLEILENIPEVLSLRKGNLTSRVLAILCTSKS